MDKKGRPYPKHIIEQWNHDKNGPMENYYLGSGKKVWWRCSNGKCGNIHEWETTINSRTGNSPTNCAICTNQKICPCFCNSLWVLIPDLRKEWIEEKNGSMKEYGLGSNKKVWWKCNKGCGNHEWKAAISSRTKRRNPTGCPICYGRQVCKCFCNSLWALRPDLRKEWNEKKNGSMKEYCLKSHSKVWWKCTSGKCENHEWKTSIYHRTAKRSTRCPFCSNIQICQCFCNSLWALRPDLRKEWNEKKNGSMKEYCLNSGKKVWWKCTSGKCENHEWKTSISNRTGKKHNGCPFCSNKQICNCFCNSLWALRPDLRKEWNEEKNGSMKKYSLGSSEYVWWKCNKGCGNHEWKAIISNRTGKNHNKCSICCNQKICECLCNSLYEQRPDLRPQWDPENKKSMKEYSVSSGFKAKWICTDSHCGTTHKWKATINSRTSKTPSGCPICSSSKLEISFSKACKTLSVNYIREHRLLIPEISSRRFDFYIKPTDHPTKLGGPKGVNFVVEMDGIQHFRYTHYFHRNLEFFKKRLHSGLQKSIYTWKHNYNLLRIAYTIDHNDIPQIIKEFIELTNSTSTNKVHRYYSTKDEYITIVNNFILHEYFEEDLTDDVKEVLEVYSGHANHL